jgi:Ca2+-binding EF-hand superfamily protein
MDLTDEQLLAVFEQLDNDDDGYVSMESLLSFAENGGHSVGSA